MRAMIAVTLVAVLSVPSAGADALVAVRLADGAALAAAGDAGAVVRHVGLEHALVQGSGAVAERLESRGVAATRIAAPRSGEELYLCYPDVGIATLERHYDVLWSEEDGAALVAATDRSLDLLRSLTFSCRPLPESIDADGWFDDVAPAHVRSRTSDDERAMRGAVRDAIQAVSEDSLMAYVERLTEYPGGELRSRFTYREECLAEAKPYLIDKLRAYLPARAQVDTQRFIIHGYTCDEGYEGPIVEYPADNVVGVLPGTGRLDGYYVVCAHYDATAASTPSGDLPYPVTDPPYYWWCENPAPGADDNGTGVATVLEAARVLSGMTFPFDIRFLLVSGEELGLYGSTAYADSVAGYRAGHDDPVAPPDTIYGVINVDMIGFKPEPTDIDTCQVVTNPASTWLANQLIDTAESVHDDLFPDFEAQRIDKALAYSDHAPFWEHDYDALIAIEHHNPRHRNGNYHTIDDAMSTIAPSQFAATAKMVVGAIARLADPDSEFNLAVFEDDLTLYGNTPGGGEYHADHFVIGEPAPMRVDFHAFGPDGSADVTVEVWDGPLDTGELLTSRSFSGTMGGGEVKSHDFEWDLEDEDLGDHMFNIRLVVTGDDELTTSDNVATDIPVRVDDPELFLVEHFPWPNPATDETGFHIAYRLSRASEGSVEIKVFDLTGQEVATSVFYYRPNEANNGLQPGLNSVDWELIDTEGGGLVSGVYIYQITVYDEGRADPVGEATGKFAVTR